MHGSAMKHGLRILGLSLLTLLATGAAAASVAQATPKFTAEGYSATVLGENVENAVFKLAGREIKCESATTDGTLTEASSTLTLTPAYAGCSVNMGSPRPATIMANGCQYVLHATKKTSEKVYDADLDLNCPGSENLEIRVYVGASHSEVLCTYKIPPFGLPFSIAKIEITPEAEPWPDIDIVFNAPPTFPYTVTGSKLLCGSSGENGEFPELFTFEYYVGGKQVGGSVTGE